MKKLILIKLIPTDQSPALSSCRRPAFGPTLRACAWLLAGFFLAGAFAAGQSTPAEPASQPASQPSSQPAAQPTPQSPAAETAVQIDNALSTSKPDDTQVPEANPARPTVTNPAHIPPVGYLQFEQGYLQAFNSPGGVARQASLIQTTKLSIHPRVMFQVQSQPIARTHLAVDNGSGAAGANGASFQDSNDTGDLILGAQYLFTLEKGKFPTIAVGYLHRVWTGSSADLDIGSYNQGGLVLVSGDLGSFHYDTNLIFSEQRSDPFNAVQQGQSVSVTHDVLGKRLHDRLELTGELWHFTQPFVTSSRSGSDVSSANAVGVLVAPSFALRPNLILDGGFDHGLTSTSTNYEVFAGFTYLLPHRLWKHTDTHQHEITPHIHRHRR